jgi:hypothetical protein
MASAGLRMRLEGVGACPRCCATWAGHPAQRERCGEPHPTKFKGPTFFPQPNQGFWSIGGVAFRDEIMIYRVLSDDAAAARAFLARLKDDVRRELRQQDVLIVERDVTLI